MELVASSSSVYVPVPEYQDQTRALVSFDTANMAREWFSEHKQQIYSNQLVADRVHDHPNQIMLRVALGAINEGKKIQDILERLGMPCEGIPGSDYAESLLKDLTRTYDIWGVDHRILRLLGSGVYGDVFLAENLETKEQVAIKVLKVDRDQEIFMHFKIKEAGGHPHIVRFIESAKIIDRNAFVMEYLDGKSLKEYGGWTPELRSQYESAISFLEDLGIRDRREETNEDKNVMIVVVDGRPTVKLIDFGTCITDL